MRGEGDERGNVRKERKGRMRKRGGGVGWGVSEGDQRTRGKMRYEEVMGDRRGDAEELKGEDATVVLYKVKETNKN